MTGPSEFLRGRKSLSRAVVIDRARADASLRAYGAVVAMASGSALGAPWALQEPPSSRAELTMSGRRGLAPATWSEVIHPAICALEAASSERCAGHCRAVQGEYSRRLVAWYRNDPQQINSALQAVLNEAVRPDAFLLRSLEAPVRVSDLECLQDNARRRWEGLRPRQRFCDNHVLPLGVAAGVAHGDREAAAFAAAMWASVTTADPLAIASCAYVGAMVGAVVNQAVWPWWDVREQVGLVEVAVDALTRLRVEEDLPLLDADVAVVCDQLGASLDASAPTDSEGGLTAYGAVARACWAVRYAAREKAANADLDVLRVGVDAAVRAGGDTEMVAAITGAVLGGVVGLSGVPELWTRELSGWPGMGPEGLRDLVVGARIQCDR